MAGQFTIGIYVNRLIVVLCAIIVFIFIGHSVAVYLSYAHGYDYAMGFIPFFYINRERSLPAFFTSCLFLIGSMLFYAMHTVRQGDDTRGKHWLLLAFVFVFLSLDEAAGLHELLIHPVRNLLGATGIFYYAWVIPYGILVVLLGLYVLGPVLRLPRGINVLFMLSAVVYVSGALGMELVGGAYFVAIGEQKNLLFELITSIEEFMEMAGLVILIYAQLIYLRRRETQIQLTFDGASKP